MGPPGLPGPPGYPGQKGEKGEKGESVSYLMKQSLESWMSNITTNNINTICRNDLDFNYTVSIPNCSSSFDDYSLFCLYNIIVRMTSNAYFLFLEIALMLSTEIQKVTETTGKY